MSFYEVFTLAKVLLFYYLAGRIASDKKQDLLSGNHPVLLSKPKFYGYQGVGVLLYLMP